MKSFLKILNNILFERLGHDPGTKHGIMNAIEKNMVKGGYMNQF